MGGYSSAQCPQPDGSAGVYVGMDWKQFSSGTAYSQWPSSWPCTASGGTFTPGVPSNYHCKMTGGSGNWSCPEEQTSFEVGSLVQLDIAIARSASNACSCWSYAFDRGSWPGGGYGSDIGNAWVKVCGKFLTKTLVSGKTKPDPGELLYVENWDGQNTTYNVKFVAVCF